MRKAPYYSCFVSFLEYKKYDSVDRTLIRQGFMAAPVSKQ